MTWLSCTLQHQRGVCCYIVNWKSGCRCFVTLGAAAPSTPCLLHRSCYIFTITREATPIFSCEFILNCFGTHGVPNIQTFALESWNIHEVPHFPIPNSPGAMHAQTNKFIITLDIKEKTETACFIASQTILVSFVVWHKNLPLKKVKCLFTLHFPERVDIKNNTVDIKHTAYSNEWLDNIALCILIYKGNSIESACWVYAGKADLKSSRMSPLCRLSCQLTGSVI